MESNGIPVTKADLDSLETRLLERVEKTETTLPREFRHWAISFETRFRANEIPAGGFNERLIALEEWISGLEHRG